MTPSGFVIDQIDHVTPRYRHFIELTAGHSSPVEIDLVSMPCITGRILWSDTGEPATGDVLVSRFDVAKNWHARQRVALDPDGCFYAHALLTWGARPDHDLDLELARTAARIVLEFEDMKLDLDLRGVDFPHDVGDLEASRSPQHWLRIVSAREGARAPIAASVHFGRQNHLGDDTGLVAFRAEPGSTVIVGAAGHASREHVMGPGATSADLAQVIELQPGATVRVVRPARTPEGWTRDALPIVRLRYVKSPWASSLFAPSSTGEDSTRLDGAYGLIASLHSARLLRMKRHRDPGGEPRAIGATEFNPHFNRDLVLEDLIPGAQFDLEVCDPFGQALVRNRVTVAAGETVVDPFATEPASDPKRFLRLDILLADGTRPPYCRLKITGPNGVIKNVHPGEDGMCFGPLAPGSYSVTASAHLWSDDSFYLQVGDSEERVTHVLDVPWRSR